VAWSTLAFLGGRAATFASLLVVARLVSPAQFGVVAGILAYLAILELAADLGMRATVIYEQEEGITRRVDVAYTLNLVLAVVLTLVGVALAPFVADFFGAGEETGLFRLAALNLLVGGLGNVHDGLLVREMAFRRRTVPLLARGVVRALVTVALAVAGLDADALVAGLLAGSVAWTLALWVLAPGRPHLCWDPRIVRSMLAYGMGAVSLQLIASVGSKVDVTIIGRALGSRALGVYALAYRIPELVVESVAWNVSAVAFPALSSRHAEDRGGVAGTALGLLRWQAVYALPATAGLALLAGPIVAVLLGPDWDGAAEVLAAIAVAEAFAISVFPLGDAFRATGRQAPWIGLQLCSIVLLVGTLLLAAQWGLGAVAWARAGETAVFAVAVLFLSRRVLGVPMLAVLGALGPGLVAALGVVLGAGAVRLVLTGDGAGVLVAGIAAGVLGAVLALRGLAPRLWGDLHALAGVLRERRRGAAAMVAA
jgi:PST family polysaccharide transporter